MCPPSVCLKARTCQAMSASPTTAQPPPSIRLRRGLLFYSSTQRQPSKEFQPMQASSKLSSDGGGAQRLCSSARE